MATPRLADRTVGAQAGQGGAGLEVQPQGFCLEEAAEEGLCGCSVSCHIESQNC